MALKSRQETWRFSKAECESGEDIDKDLILDGGKFTFTFASSDGILVRVRKTSTCVSCREFSVKIELVNQDPLHTVTQLQRTTFAKELKFHIVPTSEEGYIIDDYAVINVTVDGYDGDSSDEDNGTTAQFLSDWIVSDFSTTLGSRSTSISEEDCELIMSFEREEQEDAKFSVTLSVARIESPETVNAVLTLQSQKRDNTLTVRKQDVKLKEGHKEVFEFDVKQSEMKENGFVSEDDSISLLLTLTSEGQDSTSSDDDFTPSPTPQTTTATSYKRSSSYTSQVTTEFAGLQNQGATCYMNAMLQALFHVPAFRKCVYEMATTGQEDVKTSIPLNLQRLFARMQLTKQACSTKPLTVSFGWDSHRTYVQHDTQEFCRVLIDNLETKMKGTPLEGRIPQLFRGKYRSYIRCVDVDYESSRIEEFYDLAMQVKGCPSLEESFRKYVEKEKLEGDNKYSTEKYGKQDAEMGVEFVEFPPVLQLHLRRFEYDFEYDRNVKINSRIEFPMELDLDPFLAADAPKDVRNQYELYGVLVHSGDVSFGHYYAYLRVSPNSAQWYKFNDSTVSKVEKEEAVDSNFGSSSTYSTGYSYGYGYGYGSANAYILVYVRKSSIEELFEPVPDDSVPQHVRDFIKTDSGSESSKADHLTCYMVSDCLTTNAHRNTVGFKCREHEKRLPFGPSTETGHDVYVRVAEAYGVAPESIMLWNGSAYPYYEIYNDKSDPRYLSYYSNIFVMKVDEPLTSSSLVLFVKFFNPKWEQKLQYAGQIIIEDRKTVQDLLDQVLLLMGLPPGTPLKASEETQSKYVREIDFSSYLDKELSTYHLRGPTIVVFQVDPAVEIPEMTFKPSDAEAGEEKSSDTPLPEPFSKLPVITYEDSECTTIEAYYSENLFPKLTLIVYRYEEQEPLAVLKGSGSIDIKKELPAFLVSKLHLDVDLKNDSVVFYKGDTYDEKKPASYALNEYSYRDLSSAYYGTKEVGKDSLFVRVVKGLPPEELSSVDLISVTVKQLDRTTKTFPVPVPKRSYYSDLREKLLEMGYLKGPCREYSLGDGIKQLTPNADLYYTKQVVIEEVPEDQMELKPGERLLLAMMANVDSTDYLSSYGEPVFLHVDAKATLLDVKPQLREALGFPEEKLKQAKFYKGGRWVRYDRKGCLQDTFVMGDVPEGDCLYVVINAARKSRYGHKEEALKIDN